MTPGRIGDTASQMPADLGREPRHATALKQHENAGHGSWLTPVGSRLLAQDLHRHTGIEIELVQQEVVRMDRADIERFQCRVRKVSKIEGDHDLCIRPDRGGKYVPVLRVVGHPADERFVAGHGSVRERSAHLRDPPIDPVGIETPLDQITAKLSEDISGPQRTVRLGLGESQQGVAGSAGKQSASRQGRQASPEPEP